MNKDERFGGRVRRSYPATLTFARACVRGRESAERKAVRFDVVSRGVKSAYCQFEAQEMETGGEISLKNCAA